MKLNQTEQELEQIASQAVEKDFAVEEALRAYSKFLNSYSMSLIGLEKFQYPLLAPASINALLQRIITERAFESSRGRYISGLIQTSYDAGNNGFTLVTQDECLPQLPTSIKGTPEKNIDITIIGDTGNFCCEYVENASIRIEGNTWSYCGYRAKHSQFTILGDTEYECGQEARDCIFTIGGKNSFPNLGWASTGCTFKKPNGEIIHHLEIR